MMKKIFWLASFLVAALQCPSCAQNLQPVVLPQPQKTGGKPLMQVLSERKSVRQFAPNKLSLQTLSNMLWAGFGVNRPDGRRTAPSARNAREIDIYVCTAEGVYTYDAIGNQLLPVVAGDFRDRTSMERFAASAPLTLVYVADFNKINGEDADLYAAADTGFISENIYLYCASEGLATVVVGYIDRRELARTLHLRNSQKIILMQCVGYPKPY